MRDAQLTNLAAMDWQQHLSEVHATVNPKRAVPQIVRFQGSATEQEIWCGALSAKDADKHVFAFFREINAKQEVSDAKMLRDFFDSQVDINSPVIPREESAIRARADFESESPDAKDKLERLMQRLRAARDKQVCQFHENNPFCRLCQL